jgi:23S rRNA-/tRNA-specific pseudouridylate synthase
MTPPPSAAATILHRDADLLVLYKPAFLPTTSPDGSDCLVKVAEALDPDAPHLHASSRLDAEVTGCVTFARTDRAIEALLAARREGRYERNYLGLAERAPSPEHGEWGWPIDRDPSDARKRVALPEGAQRGMRARSRYRVLALQPMAAALLLQPETGRTHQLRVHAAKAGCPLLGDKHYGGAMRSVLADGRVVRAPRVMLHCARVRLPAIGRAQPVTVDAPLPDDLRALWQQLGGHADALAL